MNITNFSNQQFKNAATASGKSTKSFSFVPPQGARKHLETSTHITPDGKIHGEYFDKNVGKKVYYLHRNFIGSGGKPYIKKAKGLFYVEELVIEAYHGQKPQDGKDWIIYHKDGDITNNSADNLQWLERGVAYPLQQPANPDKSCRLNFNIYVYRDGTIKQKGKVCSFRNSLYDRDVAMSCPIEPHVDFQVKGRYGYERTSRPVIELFEEAGYINNNKLHFKNPVVLHRDNNYMNFAADNLEWVEEDDPRLVTFYQQKKADKDAIGYAENNKADWDRYKQSFGW